MKLGDIPCLGFIFLSSTLLMYLLVWQPTLGVTGFGWILVGFGLLLDIMTYAGGSNNRNRIPGYPQSSSQM